MDLEWRSHPEYCSNVHPHAENINKPQSLMQMIAIATKLVDKFPFVRVDFYEVGAKPVFGEMTFTPGFSSLNEEFHKKIGEELKI